MILKLPRWFVKYSQDSPRNYRQRMCQKSAPRLPEMECPGSGRVGPPTATNSHQLLLSASLAGATSATTEDIDPRGRHHTGACYDGDVHRTAHQPPPPPDTIKQVAPSHHTTPGSGLPSFHQRKTLQLMFSSSDTRAPSIWSLSLPVSK